VPIGYILVGVVLGLSLDHGSWGAVVGGVLGFILAEIQSIKRRLDQLGSGSAAQTSSTEESRWGEGASPPSTDDDHTAPPVEAKPVPVPASSSEPESVYPEPAVDSAPQTATAGDANTASGSLDWLPGWITGGNTVVRVGVIVLFFGVAFLLKYAAEHTNVPIEFRLAGVALGAIALLVTGIWLRRRREAYGLSLEGGAIGILYLVVFAASTKSTTKSTTKRVRLD